MLIILRQKLYACSVVQAKAQTVPDVTGDKDDGCDDDIDEDGLRGGEADALNGGTWQGGQPTDEAVHKGYRTVQNLNGKMDDG